MDKEKLMSEIDKAIEWMEDEKKNNKNQLKVMIDLFKRTKEKIVKNELLRNEIRGSARMYVEMYSDYMNPMLNYLDYVEKNIDEFLKK
ncbi:hypothetical protein [Xenorhabdus kozodoii]|uniref:Uncharacterized protein n=1 Tax=Xenorhabdus kozodoii TaxID=351676 RepID=A0A2D0L138_9GAMM|nr:hypothetical protein [Xenorhabdus kozodoii]PHM69406.1 hypothetical protein Xkoz_03430 [Xenorhabdus kozodoii]